MTLSANWDSYGARTVQVASVERACAFLLDVMQATTPAPQVTPSADGGLVLEWHRAGLDVEVRISPSDPTSVYWYRRESDDEGEYRLGDPDDRTTSFIDALTTGA